MIPGAASRSIDSLSPENVIRAVFSKASSVSGASDDFPARIAGNY